MERLTDDRFLKDGFYQPKSKEEEKEIRSMGNDLTFEKLYKHCVEVEKQNAELQKQIEAWKAKSRELDEAWEIASCNEEKLQKQVDELKAKQVIECYGMLKGCDMVKQAVKDTVKEIIADVKNCMRCFEDDDDGYLLKKCEFEFFMREISKRKGVEVE